MNRKIIAAIVLVLSLVISGCLGGGDDGGSGGSITTNMVGSESAVQVHEIAKMMENSGIVLNGDEDKYYEQLEKAINEKIGVPSDVPNRAAAASTPVLSKLTLNMVSYEIQLSPVEKTTFNLGEKVTVTASYTGTGSSPNDVTQSPDLKWAIYNGTGSLSGKVFTPAAAAGTTVFIVYYMENKVTRYALFRLKIIALSQLLLSKVSDQIVGSSVEVSTYDLSKIAVTAKYSNGASNDVTGNKDMKWTLASGRGTILGNIYSAPQLAESATFKATYTEAGVARSVSFRLVVTKPVLPTFTISLSKGVDMIQAGSIYDLSQIVVKADYSIGTSAEVTSSPNLTWIKSIGRGVLTGRSYASTSVAETAVFTAIYKEYGATRTAQFKLRVTVPVPPSKLVIVTEPSNPASVGTVFTQQPVIKLQDASNNDVKLAGVSVTAVRKSGTGLLQGALTVKTDADGVAAFSGLSYNLAENMTIKFTSGSIAAVESAQITVESLASDFIYGGNPVKITGYVGAGGQVVIPASIDAKVIGASAFTNKTAIIKITISDSVTSIENYAFNNCAGLTGVNIGGSVANIGEHPFSGCGSMTAIFVDGANPNYSSDNSGALYNKNKTAIIKCPAGKSGVFTIPASVTTIGNCAFYSCTGLTKVAIPAGVTSIEKYAFHNCVGLTSAGIGNNIINIGFGAFSNCTGLKSVTIPAGVTGIEGHVFANCRSLMSVSIGNNVTSIGECAFSGCWSLKSFTIPASVTSIGPAVFFLCYAMTAITVNSANPNYSSDANGVLYNKNKTTIIQYPNGKNGAFTIPSSVTNIGSSAFNYCRGLTSVTIPSSVNGIGPGAFACCTSLASVTIPASVTSVENSAFSGCSSLSSVYFDGNAPASFGQYVFYYCAGNLKLYAHRSNINGWLPRPAWNIYPMYPY